MRPPPRRAPCPPPPPHAAYNPPTVSDAKLRFNEFFKKPLPGMYSTIVQELLVQQHLFRWNKQYQYNEVRALCCGAWGEAGGEVCGAWVHAVPPCLLCTPPMLRDGAASTPTPPPPPPHPSPARR